MAKKTSIELVRELHSKLGIPAGYALERKLQLQEEPAALCDTEPDCFGRIQRLTPDTLRAWQDMKAAAAEVGVTLMLVSGFRSIVYQAELLQRKLDRGLSIEEILQVNAAPGYSEHHTGRALDVGTSDCPVLEEVFDTTPAFAWLQQYAGGFGFRMSYPRDNPHGVIYEPWHWYCTRG